MANGFAALGDLLAGGGQASAQNAFHQGQQQQATVQHLSAQTQQALEAAKNEQMKGKKAAQEEEARGQYAESALATGLAKTPEEAKAYANFMVGGAGNYAQMVQGRGGIQEQGFRDTLADPNLPLADRLGASAGVTGKIDLDPSASKYLFEKSLPTVAEQNDFASRYGAPPKIVTANGAVIEVPRSAAAPVRNIVSPEQANSYKADLAAAKLAATNNAKRMMDVPTAKRRFLDESAGFDAITSRAGRLATDESLWRGTGGFATVGDIPGTEGKRIRSQLESLVAQLSVQAVASARAASKTGGAYGNTSTREWESIGQSLAALNPAMHPDDLRFELNGLVSRMEQAKQRSADAFYETYPELGQGAASAAKTSAAPVVKWTRDANGKPVRVQ